ncbi:gamma-glutamyl-gamma-aminobutyrate hydrolase family protein [Dongia deserti]|uniref:gamma-glutamyl-gamma-aminobutyrate hydrolase family protein n=1 Tax=Dongia deserti TaxID=2268030 RepID=UPI000E647D3D|nr:gamma-glutamyl-gamma-aminobutyrate hydrolase family protein [Dongia deserti]
MKLANDAPIVAVPMCVKQIDGQNFHTVGEKYLTAVIQGAEAYPLSFPALGPVLDPAALLGQVDGVLFTGSPSNVAVHHYEGEPDRPDSPQDPGRDAVTLPLIRAAIAREVPIFCICRGFQELNVALGGTLDTQVHIADGRMDHRAPQDVPYEQMYGPRHKVTFAAGGQFARILGKNETEVNSLHWQGIAKPAPRIQVEGRAEDGVIEAVSLQDYAGFCLGAQWHPEFRVTENADSMALFKAFGAAARARRQQRLGGGAKSAARKAGAAA